MRKILSLLLCLALLLTLCACGVQQPVSDPAAMDAADEEEMASPAPVKETAAIPLPYAEKQGFRFSMQMYATGVGPQYLVTGDGRFAPAFNKADIVLTSAVRSKPDGEGYVTYTLTYEGTAYPDFVYFYASDNHEYSMWVTGLGAPSMMDYYTGTVFPNRQLVDDSAFGYASEFTWEGETYAVEYGVSLVWEHHLSREDFIGGVRGYGTSYYLLTQLVKVPDEYDGLCLAWYRGDPKKYNWRDDEIGKPYLLCDTEGFTTIDDYSFMRLDTVLDVLNGGADAPEPSALAGRVDSAEYEAILAEFSKYYYGEELDANGERTYADPSFTVYGLFEGSLANGTIYMPTADGAKAVVRTIKDFLIENRSSDRQIALKVFDADGALIGDSGLIGPGQYLSELPLDTPGQVGVSPQYFLIGNSDDPASMYLEGDNTYRHADFCLLLCFYDMEGNLLNSYTNASRQFAHGIDIEE